MRVEVKVPGDERTSTPAIFKGPRQCLTLPAAAPCRLIVVIGVICSSVWRAMSVARTPDALVLDVESCNQLAGCPGCGLNRTRPRSYGGGGDRRAWAGVPARIRWHKRRWICREHACQIATFTEQNHSVCTPRARLGASGRPGDPLGDPTVALRRSHHRRIGPTTGNHVEYRVVPHQAVSASRI